MTYLLLQTFLLLLASYFLGAFVACLAKRAIFGSEAEVPAHSLAPAQADLPVAPPLVIPPQPVRARPQAPIAPRPIDPVQPKIEVLRRPEPRPAPAVLDPSRFERALIGPDINEGVPRIAIVEVMPSVLPPVTDIYVPPPPAPPPAPPVEEPSPEIPVVEPFVDEMPNRLELVEEEKAPPRAGGLAARLRDATTAAAAGAVAAAKAAAAASVAFPGLGSTRRTPVEDPVQELTASEQANITELSEGAPVASDTGRASELASSYEEFEDTQLDALHSETEEHLYSDTSSEPEFQPQQAMLQSDNATAPAIETARPVPAPPSAPVLPGHVIESGDDFQRIRAIDANLEQKLKARGVTYFEHIAGWSVADVRRIGQELEIPGRIDREQWVEQAQILAKGGDTYYSRNRKVAQARPSVTSPVKEPAGSSLLPVAPEVGADSDQSSGVVAASQGRSVAEMAAAAAAAIAAASASVTRGLKPIEPISPLSKVDPKISMPARITDAIREKQMASVEITKDGSGVAENADGPSDDLKRIRGVGVLIEKRLNAMGVRRYEQIANWTSGDIDRVSRILEFKGRIERESWVEQARILASGGHTEFSRRVDKGEVDTSREA